MGLGPRPLTFGKSNAEASEFRASLAPSCVTYSGFPFPGPEWGMGPGTVSTPVAPEGSPVTAGEMLCLTGGIPGPAQPRALYQEGARVAVVCSGLSPACPASVAARKRAAALSASCWL